MQLLLVEDDDRGLASLELLLEYLRFRAFGDSALVLHFLTELNVLYPLLQHRLDAVQPASDVFPLGAAKVAAVWEAV